MTISINDADVAQLIDVAAWTGSIIAMLIIGLLLYWLLRPTRPAKLPPRDRAPVESEELLRQMDVLERRLELLEGAVADQSRESQELLEAGELHSQARRRQ